MRSRLAPLANALRDGGRGTRDGQRRAGVAPGSLYASQRRGASGARGSVAANARGEQGTAP
ncbi:hypothetical protein [Rubricoccus marinus]|uniref:hypothetical protein n=1 Tax=Rubricoccus marinus TaxID=716817 RepID=UPI00117B198E|nr:hypothetical protein [Rubricoccus marinus]